MFESDTIGVVGFGFVGEALYEGMKNYFTVKTFDKFKKSPSNVDTLKQLCNIAEVIFVCVPSPMKEDGSCDTSIVESVVAEINSFDFKNVVVIKSTVPPGTSLRLHSMNKGIKGVVFNPEFLTEANYIQDFKNQNRIILGCVDDEPKTIVKRVYQRAFPNVQTFKTHPTIAEMVKYTTNTFLATKVSFANEIKQICDKMSVDYDKVIEYAMFDDRLGKTHWAVPGPDGKQGFSGSCFPKDINALIFHAQSYGLNPSVMKGAWRKNLEVRPERDWLQLKGRAVTHNTGHIMLTRHWSRCPGKFVNRSTGVEITAQNSVSNVGPTLQGTIREWYETLVYEIDEICKKLAIDEEKYRVTIEAPAQIYDILWSSTSCKEISATELKLRKDYYVSKNNDLSNELLITVTSSVFQNKGRIIVHDLNIV